MEGGSGAGEVRKVHVVYFLSRNGEMEQPHLIRVRQRAHRDGVRLRDVKRWLSELRGKGMPDFFAWSYKRRYKTGYVWQDLADDDLITPVSDNEFVLKGSLTTTTLAATASTRSSSSSSTVLSCPSAATSVAADHVSPLADSAHKVPTAADPFPPGDPKSAQPPETPPAENPDRHDEVSQKPPPPVDEEEEEEEEDAADDERWRRRVRPPPQHSDASTQTTRRRAAAALHVDRPRCADHARSPLPVSDAGSWEIVEEVQPEEGGEEEKKGAPANDSCHSLLPGRRRGQACCGVTGGRASHALRSLLGCGAGAAQVDEAALLPVEPRRRGQLGGGGGSGRVDIVIAGGWHRDPSVGGARESGGGGRNWSRSWAGGAAAEQKTTAETYKPAAEPSCSQCGRPFKPERLHAHMKSCRALKSQRKNMSLGKLPKEVESHRAMLSEEASSLFLLSH